MTENSLLRSAFFLQFRLKSKNALNGVLLILAYTNNIESYYTRVGKYTQEEIVYVSLTVDMYI